MVFGTGSKEIVPLNHPLCLLTIINVDQSNENMLQCIRLAKLGIRTNLPEVSRFLDSAYVDPSWDDEKPEKPTLTEIQRRITAVNIAGASDQIRLLEATDPVAINEVRQEANHFKKCGMFDGTACHDQCITSISTGNSPARNCALAKKLWVPWAEKYLETGGKSQ